MNIAIIGTGISGLTAAWHLHREHRLTICYGFHEDGVNSGLTVVRGLLERPAVAA